MTPGDRYEHDGDGPMAVPSAVPAERPGNGWGTLWGLPADSLNHPASLTSRTHAVARAASGQTPSSSKWQGARPGPHLEHGRLLFALALLPWLLIAVCLEAFNWRHRPAPIRVTVRSAPPQPSYCMGFVTEDMPHQFLPCRLRLGDDVWPLQTT